MHVKVTVIGQHPSVSGNDHIQRHTYQEIEQVEAGGLQVWGQPGLQSEFKASLGCIAKKIKTPLIESGKIGGNFQALL
jgi:hypothetical protein